MSIKERELCTRGEKAVALKRERRGKAHWDRELVRIRQLLHSGSLFCHDLEEVHSMKSCRLVHMSARPQITEAMTASDGGIISRKDIMQKMLVDLDFLA